MPSVTCFNFRFTPSWLMIFLAGLFITFFVFLGFWQLERADEKTRKLAAEQYQSIQPLQSWNKAHTLPAPYQRIQLQGKYLPSLFLLDNQHYQHQFGYDVLTPLQLQDGSIIIIDRGWIEGDKQRITYPEINTPLHTVTIEGSAYFPDKKQWVLGVAWERKAKNLVVVELLDTEMLSKLLQKNVYPFIMRLDRQEKYGFVRNWIIVSMPPERHLAYAFQWFAMATIVFILFIILNLKKKNAETVY